MLCYTFVPSTSFRILIYFAIAATCTYEMIFLLYGWIRMKIELAKKKYKMKKQNVNLLCKSNIDIDTQ